LSAAHESGCDRLDVPKLERLRTDEREQQQARDEHEPFDEREDGDAA
jgi:hypothetical protein